MGFDKVVYSSVAENNAKVPPALKVKAFGARHIQVLMLMICLTVAISIRAQLSVSMVAMTSSRAFNHTFCDQIMNNGTSPEGNITEKVSESCKVEDIKGWSVYRKYDWDKPTQEMIMFAFFVGYTSMMLPMGVIAQKFGGKVPIMVALLVSGVTSIISPWVPIFSGWIGLCAIRLVQGMTQAAFYPSIHTTLGKWAPLCERGRLSSYVYSGSQLGTILVFQISGVFAGSPSLGWPATFWLCGVLSLVCCGLLGWLGAATPQAHPNITAEEMAFIMQDGNADMGLKKCATPWKHILTSTAVWGLVASHAGSAAGYLLVLTETPTYMSHILGVDIKKNGVYSSLPYIAMYMMALFFGFLSDFMVNRKIMSVVNIRRTCNTIGMVVSAIFMLGFSYTKTTWLALVLLVISLGLHSGVHVGFHINHIDLAPNFAGPIMAIGNMIANLTGLLIPVIVSNVVKDDVKNQQRWQIVFIILAAFQFVTNAIFVIFVKGNVQPWNFYESEQTDQEDDRKEEFKVLKEKTKSLVKEKDALENK
ncbi:hypothetical protein K1T71_008066 [Dendrolimus kikuchii]|uniref:Uncharacterized protein n=1 Tax=Dendrolimus kikuchii TaxID=765133 RepID=A0ACC1D0E5_9NEOP|nr:hypothetical protein K1T71_008066 [Dendrolimus kikuchii]